MAACSVTYCISALLEDFEGNDSLPRMVSVGGGAAGYYASIRAKYVAPALHVFILERSNKTLQKVKASGGGRCNVTTGLSHDPMQLSQYYPRGFRELKGSFFRQHGPLDTMAWFEERGVPLKMESDGRMFPESNNSSTVVQCLQNEARRLGVKVITGCPVLGIKKQDGCFQLSVGSTADSWKGRATQSLNLEADYVLLASGSCRQGYLLGQSLGHSMVDPRPSLFTFQIADPQLTEMAGTSFPNVRLTLHVPAGSSKQDRLSQMGALLITHWGISGPAVLKLSAWAARLLFDTRYRGHLEVDVVPDIGAEGLVIILEAFKMGAAKKKVGGVVPPQLQMTRRFWHYVLSRLKIDTDLPWGTIPGKVLRGVAAYLKKIPFDIAGKGEFKDEFVTAGGIPLKEIELKTMESKICNGLYLAGEVLNVDGLTGGFNFQNAWSGGYAAGTAIGLNAEARLVSQV